MMRDFLRDEGDCGWEYLFNELRKLGARLFESNPFYLISAAALLYGVGSLFNQQMFETHDGFMQEMVVPMDEFLTNTGILVGYEVLLVGTAIFLAYRKISYDARMLGLLEQFFVMIPLILLSYGFEFKLGVNTIVWTCAITLVLGVGRMLATGLFVRELQLTIPMMVCGGVWFTLNAAIPVTFACLNQPQQQALWDAVIMLAFPLFILASSLLAEQESKKNRRLPLAIAGVWASATAFHLFWITYIHDVMMTPVDFAPCAWAVCWIAYRLLRHSSNRYLQRLRSAFYLCPLVVTLVSLEEIFQAVPGPGMQVCWALIVVNLIIYTWRYLVDPRQRLSKVAAIISFFGLLGNLPVGMLSSVVPGLVRVEILGGTFLVMVVIGSLIYYHPLAGVMGSLSLAILLMGFLSRGTSGYFYHFELSWMLSFAYLLVHSSRWRKYGGFTVEFLRASAVLAVLIYTKSYALSGMNVVALFTVAVVYTALPWMIRSVRRCEFQWQLLLAGLGIWAIQLHAFSGVAIREKWVGLLVVFFSILFFGAGTLLALGRNDLKHAILQDS